MRLSEELRGRIRDLYDRGLYLQAYEASREAGDLWTWTDPTDRVLAGRLCGQLGSERLASLLFRLALREAPDHWEARYFHFWSQLRRRGVFETWERHCDWGEPTDQSPEFLADWLAQRAHLSSYLRDFERARALLKRAERLAPKRAWIRLEIGDLARSEDRREEALECFRQALELRPWYRPAVQSMAHALIQANRLDEALALLQEASERLESGDVLALLATVLEEQDRHQEAREVWRRIGDYFPLLRLDRRRRRWLEASLSDAEYACGDFAAAAEWAEKSDSPFHREIAARLRQLPTDERQRVVLPVGFTWQHHMTCAPATLTTLSQYWGRPAEHLDVVEAICYDGTAAASERKWATDQGYVAREFRVTWDVAVRLIDAGIPFTLTTVDPGMGHLQAVVGYDRFRETLLLRDPNSRPLGECRGKALLEHYRPTGPRGMVLVPPDRAGPLADIELPEAEEYDRLFEIEMALRRHDRPAAFAALEALRRQAPEHRLTWYGTRAIAAYDRNLLASVHAIEKLAEQFPDDVNLLLSRAAGLRELGRQERSLELLHERCDRPGADPSIREAYARQLSLDHRRNDEVLRHLRQVLRERSASPGPITLLAEVTWSQRDFGRALEYFRLAACLDDKDEDVAKQYFQAARNQKRTNEALAFLRDRAARYERRSSLPARTLVWAYEQLDRTAEATETMNRAVALHAEDGDLLLSAANFALTYGDRNLASERLTAAKERASRGAWLRAAAQIARFEGNLPRALKAWQEVLKREPLAADANEAVADLLAEVQGPDAAWEHVERMAARFPLNRAVRSTQLELARRRPPEVAERVARELAASHPEDPWVRRELAASLLEQRRFEEAADEADTAVDLDPNSPAGHYMRGKIFEALLQRDEARAAYRQSIELAVDYLAPMAALMSLCEGRDERVLALEFIAAELVRQTSYGDGVLHYRAFASRTLEPAEILELMRQAREARPDLWQTWTGHIQQCVDCGDLAEAWTLAGEAVRRFPLVPRLWLDQARVHELLGQEDERLNDVRRALEIAPMWSVARRALATIQEQRGENDAAVETLRRASRHAPLDVDTHVALAELHWKLGRRERAFQRLETAVKIEPDSEQIWRLMRHWAKESGDEKKAIVPARRLVELRPHETNSHLVLADVLDEFDHTEESLASIEKALELSPEHVEAHGLRAFQLAKLSRYDEALAACSPAVFGDSPPIELLARAAQVQAARGEYSDAIQRVHGLLALDPDHVWAWGQLAEWSDRLGDHETNLRASEELVRLTPERAMSHGYLGDALLRAGRRQEAKEAFERAAALQPEYAFATSSLAEMRIEDREFADLDRLLAATGSHLPAGLADAYRVQAHLTSGNHDSIANSLRKLFDCSITEKQVLKIAFRGFDEGGQSALLLAALRERVLRSEPPALVLTAYARRASIQRDSSGFFGVADSFRSRPDEFRPLVVEFCEHCDSPSDVATVTNLIHRYGEMARRDERLWTAIGGALMRVGQFREASEWFLAAPGPERGGPEGWFFQALTLDADGRFDEARELHARVVSGPGDSPYYLFHRLMLALDMALRGDFSRATSYYPELTDLLPNISVDEWDGSLYHRMFGQLRAALACEGLAPDLGRWTYAIAKDAVAVAAPGRTPSQLDNSLYRRFRIAMAKRHGNYVDLAYWSAREKLKW